jgi:NAD(P)-dependent dehydrogenase (short-subunit alcohol dehydrogenase family)
VSNLEDRTIFLTGASQGIGAVTARTLLDHGAALIAHHRGDAERADLVDALGEEQTDRTRYVAGDFMSDPEIDSAWDAALAWKGHIDTLVLNAAMMSPHGGVDDDETDWLESWDQHMRVNVLAQARLMRAAVRHFRERGGGVIILMSSWVAQRGVTNPSMLPYAASKAAIKAVAQSIARGYADQGILTYLIAPGIVSTKMSLDFAELQGGVDSVTETLAMKEWVPPEEIGELVAFLATGKVKHLSGATLDVNGATYIR